MHIDNIHWATKHRTTLCVSVSLCIQKLVKCIKLFIYCNSYLVHIKQRCRQPAAHQFHSHAQYIDGLFGVVVKFDDLNSAPHTKQSWKIHREWTLIALYILRTMHWFVCMRCNTFYMERNYLPDYYANVSVCSYHHRDYYHQSTIEHWRTFTTSFPLVRNSVCLFSRLFRTLCQVSLARPAYVCI